MWRLLCLAIVFHLAVAVFGEDVVVTTKLGDLKGLSGKVRFRGKTHVLKKFLGVPFAQPPLKELRFKPPRAPAPWKPDLYNATYYRHTCMQEKLDRDEMQKQIPGFKNFSEDCLYLNIFTTYDFTDSSSLPHPVMVFIHGGSYVAGSAQTILGDVLPLKGVVLVVIQYRLGAFGFLSTGDHHAPGNTGLLDQTMALKWVKDNIGHFGGDTDRVTIFGQSAGASSIGLHLVSSKSKGLFHQVIMQSGVDLSPWAIHGVHSALHTSQELGRMVGCPTHLNVLLVECLRKVDAQEIADFISDSHQGSDPLDLPWSPVVQGEGEEAFLVDDPKVLRENGRFHRDVRVMAGFTSDEGAAIIQSIADQFNMADLLREEKISQSALGSLLHHYFPIKNGILAGEIYNTIARGYQNTTEGVETGVYRQGMVDILTDYMFAAPAHQVLRHHSQHNETFMYVFGYRSPNIRTNFWMGTTHNDDLPFVFGLPFHTTKMRHNCSTLDSALYSKFCRGKRTQIFSDYVCTHRNWSFCNEYDHRMGHSNIDYAIIPQQYEKFDHEDRIISDYVMELWTNFAKFGHPTPPKTANATYSQHSEIVEWHLFKSNTSEEDSRYLHIDTQTVMKTGLRAENMAFWTQTFPSIKDKYVEFAPVIHEQDESTTNDLLKILPFLAGGFLFVLIVTVVLVTHRRQQPKPSRQNSYNRDNSKTVATPILTYASYDVYENAESV
ncbi:cholinesterase [Lingula anatina]|uniref:Cholinesterase n=1 Tax=Lingula anatina TaxID=7574 RepID=A0A2R2MQD7_LINAN|nr:cholinesterase [Lingula anatina]|eukprot:XP_023932222.1 cholinesterase [Lingula anatina]